MRSVQVIPELRTPKLRSSCLLHKLHTKTPRTDPHRVHLRLDIVDLSLGGRNLGLHLLHPLLRGQADHRADLRRTVLAEDDGVIPVDVSLQVDETRTVPR